MRAITYLNRDSKRSDNCNQGGAAHFHGDDGLARVLGRANVDKFGCEGQKKLIEHGKPT